jgi:hypothetical protein
MSTIVRTGVFELWGRVLVRSWEGGRGGTKWGDREGGSQGGREGERDGGRHGKREAETEGACARSKLGTTKTPRAPLARPFLANGALGGFVVPSLDPSREAREGDREGSQRGREPGREGGSQGERDGGRHGKREAETEEDTEGDWARSKLATRVLVRKAWEGGSPFHVILLSMLPRGGASAPSGRSLGSNIT